VLGRRPVPEDGGPEYVVPHRGRRCLGTGKV